MRSTLLLIVYSVVTLFSSFIAERGVLAPTPVSQYPSVAREVASYDESTESSCDCLFESCDCESEPYDALATLVPAIPNPAAKAAYHVVTSEFPSVLPHSIFHPPLFS